MGWAEGDGDTQDGVDPNIGYEDGLTALHQVRKPGGTQDSVDPNIGNEDGLTALHQVRKLFSKKMYLIGGLYSS